MLKAVEALRDELAAVSAEIVNARQDAALYSGVVLGPVVATRLQVLALSRALIEQRISALESGTPLSLSIPASEPDLSHAGAIERELVRQGAILAEKRAEAARYAGSAMGGIYAIAVATQETSIAMLRQRYLAARYGIAFVIPETAPGSEVNAAAPPFASSSPQADVVSAFEVLEVNTRVTESNDSWSRFAWKLTVRSVASRPVALAVHIKFLDEQGFVIAEDRAVGLLLRAGRCEDFNGNALIPAEVAGDVRSVSAETSAEWVAGG